VSGTLLALETSCDDTCAAVIGPGGEILSNVISSQGVHDAYGGVVPEIASRRHLELVGAVVDDALARADVGLEGIDGVAVTQGPGLAGALLVGVSAAKGLALATGLPLYGVDHLQGHVSANFVAPDPFEPPFIALVASGGHTMLALVRSRSGYELLGQTIDDAAGEAFDKGARMLGLGFPGGPALEKLARDGDPEAFHFPVADRLDGLDFSFSGLKTALLYATRDLGPDGTSERAADLAASYQEAIVKALVSRLRKAVEQSGVERVAIGGGVAANGLLRERVGALGLEWHAPEMALCTDNAAMIGVAALELQPLDTQEAAGMEPYTTSRPSA
jgi:N6-L-threonylcarbamoyladenine synthase